jgi:glutamyl-tRNA synthetase
VRRVRFAPSPTGPLHVGGLRTALFNYLFTKNSGGDFILRIEDTDKKREVPGAEQYIVDALAWCGITPDEGPKTGGKLGPYRQSERNHLYEEKIKILVNSGQAYYAFDSEEELNLYREDSEKKGETFIYNWKNRKSLKNSLSLDKESVEKLLEKGEKHVIRFLSPESQEVKTVDVIRGESVIDSSLLDDKILIKANGTPTYHFANVVDDHLMKITHVIRGEEWLPSLALHVLLYDAFGWEKPIFAHLPLILNPHGKGKLSKRSGEKGGFPVFPIDWREDTKLKGFRESGILPEGLVNYLATLGWSPEEGLEILTLRKLTELFLLENVVSSAANFDFEKLKWYNHKHIQTTESFKLAELLESLNKNAGEIIKEKLADAITLVKERANTVSDLWGLVSYLFFDPISYDEKSLKKISKDGLEKIVSEIISQCKKRDGTSGFVENLTSWGDEIGIGAGQIMMTTRVILTGSLTGVGVQEIVSFIGLESVGRRAEKFEDRI